MSVHLKITPLVIALFIGVSLTCASFAYQKIGPEMASYGNAGCEVQPNSCMDGQMRGPVLGAGFPWHYVLDNTATSVWHSLGIEDNFEILPFLMDVLFYTGIIYGSIKFTQNYQRHGKKPLAKITA